MSKAYASNLTSDQWELLEPLIPAAGRSASRSRNLNILNAILYLLSEGCRWRSLPGDFPAWQTVYTYFRNWRIDGTWVSIHRLREWVRVDNEREASPSEVIVDSQSVKPLRWSQQSAMTQPNRLGRKRHLTVDTLGLVLRVFVSAANVGERKGAKRVRASNAWAKPSESTPSGSMAMMAPFLIWVMDVCRWIVQVVLPDQRLCLAQKRWVVERTFGWLMGSRRLVRDYELLPQTSETFIYMIRLMVKRLA